MLTFVEPVPEIPLFKVFVPPVTFKVPAFLIAALEFDEAIVTLDKFVVPPDAFTTEPSELTAFVILTFERVNVFPLESSKPVLPFIFIVDLEEPLATPLTFDTLPEVAPRFSPTVYVLEAASKLKFLVSVVLSWFHNLRVSP